MSKERLSWSEIYYAADPIFNVMNNKREIKFAEMAWENLEKVGLTSYCNYFEKVKTLILFVALGDLFRDFYYIAHDEYSETSYSDMIDLLEIDEFTFGRVYQEFIKPQEEDICDGLSTYDALKQLSNHFRQEIYDALIKSFGTISELFLRLWQSTYPYSDEDNLDENDILFSVTPEKGRAFEWISEGCYVLNY